MNGSLATGISWLQSSLTTLCAIGARVLAGAPRLVSGVLRPVVAVAPDLLLAAAMLAVGVLAARVVHDMTEGGVRAAGMPDRASATIAAILRISVLVFAMSASLSQLGSAGP